MAEDPEDAVTQVTREVVDCGDHSALMLAGLDRLRQSGLLLDTLLWAEGVSFQVSEGRSGSLLAIICRPRVCPECQARVLDLYFIYFKAPLPELHANRVSC